MMISTRRSRTREDEYDRRYAPSDPKDIRPRDGRGGGEDAVDRLRREKRNGREQGQRSRRDEMWEKKRAEYLHRHGSEENLSRGEISRTDRRHEYDCIPPHSEYRDDYTPRRVEEEIPDRSRVRSQRDSRAHHEFDDYRDEIRNTERITSAIPHRQDVLKPPDRSSNDSGGLFSGLGEKSDKKSQQLSYARELERQIAEKKELERKGYDSISPFRKKERENRSNQFPGPSRGQRVPMEDIEANERRKAQESYSRELQRQIQEKESRSTRNVGAARARQQEEVEIWDPFGKPGAGAPFRDASGRIVTNLKNFHSPSRDEQIQKPSRYDRQEEHAYRRGQSDEYSRDRVGFRRDAPSEDSSEHTDYYYRGRDLDVGHRGDRMEQHSHDNRPHFQMGLKDLSETRADRNQCASKKMEAENYAKELEEQVRMKETRKEKERREREERERKELLEMQSYDPFGKPGAGAPFRDSSGKPIGNLRELKNSPESARRNISDRRISFGETPYQPNFGSSRDANKRDGTRSPSPLAQQFGSPSDRQKDFSRHGFSSYDPQVQSQRSIEHQKQLELQDALRQQIEEKKRREEERKKKEAEEERNEQLRLEREQRELEERARLEDREKQEKDARKRAGVGVFEPKNSPSPTNFVAVSLKRQHSSPSMNIANDPFAPTEEQRWHAQHAKAPLPNEHDDVPVGLSSPSVVQKGSPRGNRNGGVVSESFNPIGKKLDSRDVQYPHVRQQEPEINQLDQIREVISSEQQRLMQLIQQQQADIQAQLASQRQVVEDLRRMNVEKGLRRESELAKQQEELREFVHQDFSLLKNTVSSPDRSSLIRTRKAIDHDDHTPRLSKQLLEEQESIIRQQDSDLWDLRHAADGARFHQSPAHRQSPSLIGRSKYVGIPDDASVLNMGHRAVAGSPSAAHVPIRSSILDRRPPSASTVGTIGIESLLGRNDEKLRSLERIEQEMVDLDADGYDLALRSFVDKQKVSKSSKKDGSLNRNADGKNLSGQSKFEFV